MLLVARRDAWKKFASLFSTYEDQRGTATPEMINVRRALLNAELEVAESPQQQMEIIEKALRAQREEEHQAIVKYDVGLLPPAELIPPKSQRLWLEIQLHKARRKVH